MNKVKDWEERLHQFFIDSQDKPFEWGTWDCCKFVDAAVVAMTNEHLIPSDLDWKNEKEARTAISAYGRTLTGGISKAAKAAGLSAVNPSDVKKGDVVVVKDAGARVAGLCDGYAILSPSDDGYTYRPKSQAHKVFRING